jgi:hypothetical protein
MGFYIKQKKYFILRDKFGIFATSSRPFAMRVRGIERLGEVVLIIPRFELGDKEHLEMERERIALQQWLKNLGMGNSKELRR